MGLFFTPSVCLCCSLFQLRWCTKRTEEKEMLSLGFSIKCHFPSLLKCLTIKLKCPDILLDILSQMDSVEEDEGSFGKSLNVSSREIKSYRKFVSGKMVETPSAKIILQVPDQTLITPTPKVSQKLTNAIKYRYSNALN